MAFDRTRVLTFPIEPGETYSYGFDNIVTVSGDRNEVRILKRTQYRAEISFSNLVLQCGEELDFIDFYRASRGTVDAFIYKSTIEYTLSQVPDIANFDLGFFTYTQGVGLWNNNLVTPRWQIYKKFAVATGDTNSPVDVSCTYKRIFEPDTLTLLVYVNGTAQPATYDFSTGLLSIPSASNPATDVITIAGEFLHRVRFGDQSEDSPVNIEKLSQAGAYSISNLKLIEVFVDNTNLFDLYEDKDFSENKQIQFALPLEVENSRSIVLPALVANLDNGREQRLPNTEITYTDESLTPSNLYYEEMRLLSDFFVAMKGRLVSFRYQQDDALKYVRFNQDLVSITKKSYMDSLQQCKTVYDVSTLDLIATTTSINDYEVPPFSLEVQALTINPLDTNLDLTTASGTSLYTGNNSLGVGATNNAVNYNLSVFNGQNVTLSGAPPDDVAGISYFCAGMFWGGGTLNLLVSTTAGASRYRQRLIHYVLDASTGLNFVYHPTSNALLKNYIVSTTSINSPAVFRRNEGTAQYFLANNTVAFGNVAGWTSATPDYLRFQVNDNGSIEVSFLPAVVTGSQVPTAIFGNRAGIVASGGYQVLGTFDGNEYFKPSTSLNTGVQGYPFGNTDATGRVQQYNVWRDQTLVADQSILRHTTDPILTLYTGGYTIYVSTGEDGSYFYRVAATVCEQDLAINSCPLVDRRELIYIFHKTSYDATPQLIDVMLRVNPNNSTGGASYYVQTVGNAPRSTTDKFGNYACQFGNFYTFYKAGSSRGIAIAGLLGYASSLIRTKPCATPFGFATFAHSNSNIFAVSNTNYLTFVQAQSEA